jgi:hypothetical protein
MTYNRGVMKEMKMKHTPGPWRLDELEHPEGERQSRDVMDYDYEINPPSVYLAECSHDGGQPPHFVVCRLKYGHHVKADARLIAAAPEMLAALKGAVESLEQLVALNRIPANNAGLREARAAIAKAEESAVKV